jgi:dTDP-4-amino-4,6-dideoxygalactose transaminase
MTNRETPLAAPGAMRVPLLDLRAQYESVRAEIHAAIDRVLESQHFILGREAEALERDVAAYCQCAHGVGVSSGTDAILVALMALGIGPGDEVVTTPYTFVATAGSIARLGARAVFVDIDPATFNLDATRVDAAITSRTRAIMPVHLYGQMADVATVAAIARARSIPVIEDAAQAIGAEQDGRRACTNAAFGCLSFFPSKNLGAYGDGGMVVSNDAELATRARLLRNQGQSPKYYSVALGGNFRLDELQAAVLRAKLPHLDDWSTARQRNAERYRVMFSDAGVCVPRESIGDAPGIALPEQATGRRHIYNQFVVRATRRDALRQFLIARGIGCEVYYPQPMHLQACFSAWGHREGDFPVSERAAAETLAIPVHPELTEAMQQMVVDAVRAFYRRAS